MSALPTIAVRAVLPACLYGGQDGTRQRARLAELLEAGLPDGITVEHRADQGIVFRLEWVGVKAAGAGAFDAVNALAAMAVGVETAAERLAKRGKASAKLVDELNRAVGAFEVKARAIR